MDALRHYLQQAWEAEAIANASVGPVNRRHWEDIAAEYRRLARAETERRKRRNDRLGDHYDALDAGAHEYAALSR